MTTGELLLGVGSGTVANDPRYPEQWALHPAASEGRVGIDVPAAWSLTRGSRDLVVAVVDTGGLAHPDVVDRLVPGLNVVRDDDGSRVVPDDGTDPGDRKEWEGGRLQPSSWHGTHVAGIIGASTDNGRGISGVDQRARIQHIHALGVGGAGHPLDVATGIRWAAGVPVTGLPANPTPARVINLSLGGPGRCPTSLQAAIDAASAAGAVIVAAAGNEAVDLRSAPAAPVGCDGVISVTAVGEGGHLASYANTGPALSLAAPGGDGEAIVSTYNPGGTVPPPSTPSVARSTTTPERPEPAWPHRTLPGSSP